jgi:long-chain acyl-CoA synthetase
VTLNDIQEASAATAPVMSRAEALAILTAPGEPYALETKIIRDRAQRVFAHAPACLGVMFEATASDLPFIIYEQERISFAEAQRQAQKISRLLVQRFGIGKGDRVAISMRNYPEWILVFQAATSIGAIAVAMNAHWQPDEMAYGLADSGAKVLFADAERLERLARAKVDPALKVVSVRAGQVAGAEDLADLLARFDGPALAAVTVDPEDNAIIYYTSGSTGFPKGVVSTHRNVISALMSWELDLRAGALSSGIPMVQPAEQPATLLGVPLFHVTGSHAVFLQSYRTQRRLVAMYKWDPDQAASLIERERITTFTGPAAMTGDLVRVAKETNKDLSSMVSVGGGGAPRAPEQVRQIQASFEKALPATGWGMTETNAIGTGIGGLDYLGRPASSGRCSAVLELLIVNEAGVALAAGEPGELLVRGTSVFPGYWNRDDLNKTLFEDGWFRTGDVAYLDDEGFLFIVDRIKDLIIRGGENIGCGQVEAALLTHPDIHEAAVYAVPDERLGEEVGATLFSDMELDPEAIRTYLAGHLAKFEVPRYILITHEPLARTASGKILKRDLRAEAVKHFASLA